MWRARRIGRILEWPGGGRPFDVSPPESVNSTAVRRLLPLLATLLLLPVAAPVASVEAAPHCFAAATGLHSRDQSLPVRLTGTCPATGTLRATLRFTQFPSLVGSSAFTLDWATKRLTLHVPSTIWLNGPFTARFTGVSNQVTVTATPRRHVTGQGTVTITGGFTASNHATVSWRQTVKVTPTRIDVGSVNLTAHLPGTRSLVLQVRRQRGFCATGHSACPYGSTTAISTFTFPASATTASAHTASTWTIGTGFTSLRETVSVVLRDHATGRVLGRSDFSAAVRA
jgi:hypothetical protein